MNVWDRTFVDGCAIFFKSDRFKLEEKHLFEFNQVALARPSLRKHKDMYNRVMTRDNIAVACRLTHLESDQSILLGTVHIHWDPSHKDVKLVQTIMLIEEMERLLSKHPQSAMILCGDFNALQESGVGEFLENGSIGTVLNGRSPSYFESKKFIWTLNRRTLDIYKFHTRFRWNN